MKIKENVNNWDLDVMLLRTTLENENEMKEQIMKETKTTITTATTAEE